MPCSDQKLSRPATKLFFKKKKKKKKQKQKNKSNKQLEREGTWGREWRLGEDNRLLWSLRAIAALLALALHYKASLTVSWLPFFQRERVQRVWRDNLSLSFECFEVFLFIFWWKSVWVVNKLYGVVINSFVSSLIFQSYWWWLGHVDMSNW